MTTLAHVEGDVEHHHVWCVEPAHWTATGLHPLPKWTALCVLHSVDMPPGSRLIVGETERNGPFIIDLCIDAGAVIVEL